jgi:hypothetical protein
MNTRIGLIIGWLLLSTACATTTANSQSTGTTIDTTTVPATTVPATTESVTVEEAIADALFSPGGDEMITWTVLVDSGYGSHSIATPRGWVTWQLGTDPDLIATVVEGQDPLFGARIRSLLREHNQLMGSANFRSAYTDPSSDPLLLVLVGLHGPPDGSGDLEAQLVERTGSSGGQVIDSASRPVSGGTVVDMTVRFDPGSGTEPLVVHMMYFLDEVNGFMWAIECTVHDSNAAAISDTCSAINGSFEALPPIGG